MVDTVFEAMRFPPKVLTAFAKARPPIKTIGDLIVLTPAQVMKIPGIGPLRLGDIEMVLAMQKLALAERTIGGQALG